MLFQNDRDEMRRFFVQSWRRRQAGEPLEALQELICQVVEMHPEYQYLLRDEQTALGSDYPATGDGGNPFLHMALHISVREQLASAQPPELAEVHRRLSGELGDDHAAEHLIIEALAETLWEAQGRGMPDQRAYVQRLLRLGRSGRG